MYQKEIIYIGLYKGGSRMGSAGFLKVESKDRENRMYLKVQNLPLGINGRFPIRVYNGSDWKELSSIAIQDGGGRWEESVTEPVDRTILLVSLSGGYTLEGRSRSAPEITLQKNTDAPDNPEEQVSRDTKQDAVQNLAQEPSLGDVQNKQPNISQHAVYNEQQNRKETSPTPETIIVTEELPRRSQKNIDVMPYSMPEYNLKEDKWEQILDLYEQIHPYGDERVYVKLEPKDFVILQSGYQHLVNNSFLLHGFYNYRYVILGKEQNFYLGVPGVFYEREKMVAQMFGFEAFECPGGNVRAGEFGYYLRKVEL